MDDDYDDDYYDDKWLIMLIGLIIRTSIHRSMGSVPVGV